jgi:hypothetical protein
LSYPLDLRVGLVRLVAGRELGWDGVIVVKVDVGGVGSLRGDGRRIKVGNAVVVVSVAIVVDFVVVVVVGGDVIVIVVVVVVIVVAGVF